MSSHEGRHGIHARRPEEVQKEGQVLSIVFSTPMYGGLCTAEYFQSCLDLRGSLVKSGIDHQFLITTNESLITRARNTAVARFMFDPDLQRYDRFMFIDADIEFNPEDVQKLWNLDVDVACAAYPMKREEAGVTAWKNGKLIDLDGFDGPTEIDFAGTGFLMIKRQVFESMMKEFPHLEHEEGKVGRCFAFFDTGVVDDGSGPYYISEDYYFCKKARKMGLQILLEPSIRLGHVGRKVYR